jgi:hypothetical protein
MMMLEQLFTDDAYIVDEKGDRRGPYKTRFGSQNTLTFLDEALEIVVDTSYQIVRLLDDGEEIVFNVIEYDFQERINRIPPQHVLKIENINKPDEETLPVQKKSDDSKASQVEEHYTVNIPDSIIELIERINSSESTPEEKEGAKSIIKKLVENPTISTILGEATAGLLLLLD